MALQPCRECGKEVSSEADKCPNCGMPIRVPVVQVAKKSGMGCGTWLLLGIGALVVIAIGQSAADKVALTKPNSPESIKARALLAMGFHLTDFRMGGFGTVPIISAKIVNGGAKPVKDVELECTLLASSRTSLGKIHHTIYQTFVPGDTIRIKDETLGIGDKQTESISCSVADLTVP